MQAFWNHIACGEAASCVKNIVKYGKRTFQNCRFYRSGDVLFADMEVFKGQGNDTKVLRLI